MERPITIGLFGTCGDSRWREPFMARYQELGISFYNPQVPAGTWTPDMASVEARHLAEDEIILFPVTSETYGTGSLAETGFSIVNAINLNDRRFFVIMIDQDLDGSLNDKIAREESLRARKLVKAHLLELNLPNVFIVNTLEAMLEVSLTVYQSLVILKPLARLTPRGWREQTKSPS